MCNVGVVRTELDLMCDVGVGCGRIFDASTWCVLPTSVVKNTHHSFDSLLSVYHFFCSISHKEWNFIVSQKGVRS